MRYLQKLAGGVSPWNVIVKADNVLDPEILHWVKDRSLVAMDLGDPAKGHYLGGFSNLGYVMDTQLGGIPKTAERRRSHLIYCPGKCRSP